MKCYHVFFWLFSQFITTTQCCKPSSSHNHVKVGSVTYVCVVINRLNWELSNHTKESHYYRTSKKLYAADDLSNIRIKNSWTSNDYNNDTLIKMLDIEPSIGDGLAISVESMGLVSYQKIYRTVQANNNTVTFPLLLAIINVDHGAVQGITWDDTCSWCSAHHCKYNTYDYFGNLITDTNKSCWVSDDQCVYSSNNINGTTSTSLCELNVYITWTGTDVDGYYFNSASSRFSRLGVNQLLSFTSSGMNTAAK